MRDRCAKFVNALPDVTVRDSPGTFEGVAQPRHTRVNER